MILLVILTCLFGLSHQFPYQHQLQYQNSPSNWIYPGLRQSVSYRPVPIITTYPLNNQLTQNYNLQTNLGMSPTFKQGFPGNVIGSLPFIPIHINVPDIIGAIIKGLQSIFGPVPIIQQSDQMQNNPQDIMMAQQNQGSMLPIGMIDKIGQPTIPLTMPIPIIIVLPSKQDSNDESVQEA